MRSNMIGDGEHALEPVEAMAAEADGVCAVLNVLEWPSISLTLFNSDPKIKTRYHLTIIHPLTSFFSFYLASVVVSAPYYRPLSDTHTLTHPLSSVEVDNSASCATTMSILNHSISPTGQPILNSKDYAIEDACQHVQLALPFHGAKSANPTWSHSEKKTSVSATKGIFRQAQPLSGASSTVTSTNRQTDIMKQTDQIFNLSHLFGNEHHPGYLDGTSSTDVLAVAVSSAVKLDSRQIDLITRKMQRLTGFRTLKLENNVDPSLIAGFVISYCNDGSQVIDLSVKGQLAMLAAPLESSDQAQNAAHFGQT